MSTTLILLFLIIILVAYYYYYYHTTTPTIPGSTTTTPSGTGGYTYPTSDGGSLWTATPALGSQSADISTDWGIFTDLSQAQSACNAMSNCVGIFSRDGAWVGHSGTPLYQLASTLATVNDGYTGQSTIYTKTAA
jgi:hypothetical protein